jgi:ABC-2 type transport system ATP-binding protein
MLSIRNLSKTYKNGKRAVKGVSLEIAPGSIHGFIGHNGAGKTTTLKCVAGILDFDEGEIFIDGRSVRREPLACKQVTAYIPDNPDLYENLTAIQFINFVADVYRVPKTAREREVGELAEAFELSGNLGDLISSFSHGMKQKTAIIAALMHSPKLLVLDEPFTGLDPKASFILKERMRAICTGGGAVFFSTHVLDVAEKFCDRVAIIKNGEIVVSGETEAVTGDSSLEQIFMELVET